MYIEKYNTSKYWAIREDNNDLICVTVYKKGALEVIKRFELVEKEIDCKFLEKLNINNEIDNVLKNLKTINAEVNELIKYLKTIKN